MKHFIQKSFNIKLLPLLKHKNKQIKANCGDLRKYMKTQHEFIHIFFIYFLQV